MWLHNPVEVLTDDRGDVRGLLVERMELGEPDERGRRRPVGTGERFEVACDTVIVALGTNPNPIVTRNTEVALATWREATKLTAVGIVLVLTIGLVFGAAEALSLRSRD